MRALVPAWPPGAKRSTHQGAETLRGGVDRCGQPGRAAAEHDDVECLTVDLRSQPELVGHRGDGRPPDDVVGADQHGALVFTDAEAIEQDPAFLVRREVVPGERNQVALQQLSDGERVARPARADQLLLAEAATHEPIAAGDHGSQEEVAEVGGSGRDHPPHVLRRERDERRRSGGVPGGERRLPGEHGEIADEGGLLALGEVAVALRRLIDDVHGSALDDEERGLALAVPEHLLAPGERLLSADPSQVLDLLRRQPREHRRIVRIQEVLHGSW